MRSPLPALFTAALVAIAINARAAHAQTGNTVCKDGTRSTVTGRGACSGHGGVDAKATEAAKKAAKKAEKAEERNESKAEEKAEKKADKAAKKGEKKGEKKEVEKKVGAEVKCADGTMSKPGRGACSRHGGIAKS